MGKLKNKFSLLLFIVLSLFFIVEINVHAAQAITMVDGAQIRTTGEYQGLRFSATASEAFLEGSTHGFFVAKGEHSLEAMKNAIENDAERIGDNKLVNKVFEDDDLEFNLVIYGIPETSYKQDITVLAYILDENGYTFPTIAVTRNIAEVAVAAYPTYGEDVPDIIAKAATQTVNYNMNGGVFVGEKEFTITRYNADTTGANIKVTNVAAGQYSRYYRVLYLKSTSYPNVFEIVKYTNATAIDTTGTYDLYIGAHNEAVDKAGYNTVLSLMVESSIGKYISLSSIPTTAGTVSIDAKVFNIDEYQHATGTTTHNYVQQESLKPVTKKYYDFGGWYDNAGLTGSPITTITSGNCGTAINLYAKFTPIVYSVTYELNDGDCSDIEIVTNYTYESQTITLPANNTMSRDGFTFGGWYDNPAFAGLPVTSIPTGSNGNKVFYAQWISDSAMEHTVSSSDVAVLNVKTPDFIVNPDFENGTEYVLKGTGLSGVYEDLELVGFTTIADAMTYLKANSLTNKNVYIFVGTYSSTLTIDSAGTTIYGPNYNIHGHDTRVSEANITGLTTISAANVTLDGLKFSVNGAIKVGEDNATINHIYMNANQVDANGVNRRGCIVDSANMKGLSVLNSWIKAPGASQSYMTQYMAFNVAEDLTIQGNYIENEATTFSSAYAGMRIYNPMGTINIKNNEFHFATTGYVMVIGEYAHSCQAINIIDNIFAGRGNLQTATIQIKNGTNALTTTIRGNQFINFGPATYNFNGDMGSTVNITYNYYDNLQDYRVSDKGNANVSTGYNCYDGVIASGDVSGAASETTKFTTLAELQAAYAIAYPPAG